MPVTFNIKFVYLLEGISEQIHLHAQVESRSEELYIVRDVKTNSGRHILPDQRIKKLKNLWVHTDSEKETHLSQAMGTAIEYALRSKQPL